jgi:hypothetical protein
VFSHVTGSAPRKMEQMKVFLLLGGSFSANLVQPDSKDSLRAIKSHRRKPGSEKREFAAQPELVLYSSRVKRAPFLNSRHDNMRDLSRKHLPDAKGGSPINIMAGFFG